MNNNLLTDVIFDGNNLAHRASFGPTSPNSDGVDTSSLKRMIQMVLSAVRQIDNVRNIYMVWDKRISKDAVNYRKLLVDSVYKQNRDHSKNNHIFEMIDKAVPIFASMGIRNMFPYSLEGDDVIAWLARHHCNKSTIISIDEDLWQLVDFNVTISNPKKGLITVDNFESFSPVPLKKYVLWKCILGDASDFVKGLEGYGKKKAPILAMDYEITRLDHQQIQTIELNKQLLDLEYSLTQSPMDIKAFESQVAFHASSTKFDRNKFTTLVVEAGIPDLCGQKTIQEIQQLSKSQDLFSAFEASGLMQL